MTYCNIGMDVIETQEQIDDFLNHYQEQDEVFVDAVRANEEIHPRCSGVSYVLVRTSNREALFPVRHNDATTLNPKKLLRLNTDCRKYVFGKKRVLHLVPFRNLIDCKLLYWFVKNRPPKSISVSLQDMMNIYKPIMRLAEKSQKRLDRCEDIVESFGNVIEKRPFQKYNEEVLETLFRVERSGMYSTSEAFSNAFEGKDLTDDSNLSYSKYNVYTQTGRPSNAHRGVNYAALDPDQRKAFESRFDNGKLLNVDYDAFHLRVISSIIDYDAPEGSFHKHLARLYFGKEEITDEEYEEAKKFTFQFLYNPKGIPEELLQLEFFRGVKDLTEKIWNLYQKHGVIQTAKHGRQITGSEIENFNPAKALSYILQSTGTEIVMEKANKFMNHINENEYNTKLILYLYDSLLFDLHPDDPDKIIEEFEDIMEDEYLSVNSKIGETFADV